MEYDNGHELHAAAVVGCGISLFFCILALGAFVFFRPRTDAFAIKKHLTAAVALAQVTLLLGNAGYKEEVGCQVLTVILHYVATACFTWNSVDAFYLYYGLVNRFHPLRKSWYYLCYGWALPLVVLILTPVIGFTGARGERDMLVYSCWPSVHVVWTFVIPSLLIATVNVVTLSVTLHQLCQPSYDLCARSVMDKKATRYGLRTNSLMVLGLCMGWVFGIFSFRNSGVPYELTFGLLNGLQGIFLFFFHCVLNLDIKGYYETGAHVQGHTDGKTDKTNEQRPTSRLQEQQAGSHPRTSPMADAEDATPASVEKGRKSREGSARAAESNLKMSGRKRHVILDATPSSDPTPRQHTPLECDITPSLPGTPELPNNVLEVKAILRKKLSLELMNANVSAKNGAVGTSATLATVASPVSPVVEGRNRPLLDRLEIRDRDDDRVREKSRSDPAMSEKDSQHASAALTGSASHRKRSVHSSTPSPSAERKHRKSSRPLGSSLNELESLFSNPALVSKPHPPLPAIHGHPSRQRTHPCDERERKISSSDSVKDVFPHKNSLGEATQSSRRASGLTQETML